MTIGAGLLEETLSAERLSLSLEACVLQLVEAQNNTAGTLWLMYFDQVAQPVDTDVPRRQWSIATGKIFSEDLRVQQNQEPLAGMMFENGCWLAWSSTADSYTEIGAVVGPMVLVGRSMTV